MRALVTGATGQLGAACCEALETAGWKVTGVSRTGDDSIHRVNLVMPSRIHDFLLDQDNFDLVIMTHGTQATAELGQADFTYKYLEVLDNNLNSAVYLTDVLIDHNQLNPGALLVYCSSIHALHPRKGRAPYAIAKAGLEALVRVLALEQAKKGIRAVALRLGQMAKPMKGVVFTQEQEAAIRERAPLEWVDPKDVAALCLDLYKQKSLSGAILDVDSAHSLNVWP